MISSYVFWPIAFLIIACAIGVVHSKNIIHSALSMILTFIGIAVVFILLAADFLALAQILIYAGAISILIVFAIMLTRKSDMKNSNPFNKLRWTGLIFCLGFFAIITRLILVSKFTYKYLNIENTISAIADGFFGNYMIPFEV
ncbi:NADH-quinone oxidoreductase subunit J, partial [Clostridium sp. Maddingley MBC34-26]|uniref:NADH-quinone oxidoreductase subunit J family protein n=1 Tax=Clostridium sp. Maddingley MBC34-26 TaxID=1196322 RepID=UPI00029770D1